MINLAVADRMARYPTAYTPDDFSGMVGDLAAIAGAAQMVADVCHEALDDAAESFNCREAERIAQLLRLAGNREQGDRFLWFHALGDTEDSGDDARHIELAEHPYETAQERES
jgi:hypothetical protein